MKKDQRVIHDDIDKALMKLETRDKIKVLSEIKESPPKPNYMKTNIDGNIYAIDLNVLLQAQIADCPATVIPMLIDHAVRTAVDIKDTYKPEKRILDFTWIWLLILIIGLGIVFLVMNMIFKIF